MGHQDLCLVVIYVDSIVRNVDTGKSDPGVHMGARRNGCEPDLISLVNDPTFENISEN